MNNKGSIELITMGVIAVIIFAIAIPIFYSVIDKLPNPPPNTTIAIFGLLIISIGVSLVLLKYTSTFDYDKSESYIIDTNDIAIEPTTKKLRDAKKILKIRYAKGEISSSEYTEKMSRL